MTSAAKKTATDSGLFVNFYGKKGGLKVLHDYLCSKLNLSQDPRPKFIGTWCNSDKRIRLSLFDPLTAPDTSVVQLTLSEEKDEEAINGWQTMYNRLKMLPLEDIFSKKHNKGDDNEKEGMPVIWGYTLVYEAVLAPGIDAEDVLPTLLPWAKHFGKSDEDPPRLLARSQIRDGIGHLWLVNRAIERDELDAANVYIALAPHADKDDRGKDKEDYLIENILLGPKATLLMPDLIAHKGYYQIRQYTQRQPEKSYARNDTGYVETDLPQRPDMSQTEYIQQYKRLLHDLMRTIDPILNKSRQEIISNADINRLSYLLDNLVSRLPELERLHISLKRQVYNYAQWQASWEGEFADNKVFDRHRKKLETATEDLELNVIEGKGVLEGVRVANDMIQLRLNKAREQRQQAIGILLAVLATALSIPQMIDREAVRLLTYFAPCMIGGPVTGSECYELGLLGGQIAFTIIAALVVGFIVKKIGDRRWRSG